MSSNSPNALHGGDAITIFLLVSGVLGDASIEWVTHVPYSSLFP